MFSKLNSELTDILNGIQNEYENKISLLEDDDNEGLLVLQNELEETLKKEKGKYRALLMYSKGPLITEIKELTSEWRDLTSKKSEWLAEITAAIGKKHDLLKTKRAELEFIELKLRALK